MSRLKTFLIQTKQKVDATLKELYINETNDLEHTGEAMNYMLNIGDGGKRIRPALVLAVTDSFNGNTDLADKFAIAAELIHTYTLIIDDIQDGGILRRGQPCCHVKYGTNLSLLAASRLFEHGLKPFHQFCSDTEIFDTLISDLHRGQAADLHVAKTGKHQLTSDHLMFIHAGKTSSLIQISLLGGARSSGLSKAEIRCLMRYGYYAGLAFQMQDDLLSYSSTAEVIGKAAGKQADADKLTYFDFTDDADQVAAKAEEYAEEAIRSLDPLFGQSENLLKEIVNMMITRKK